MPYGRRLRRAASRCSTRRRCSTTTRPTTRSPAAASPRRSSAIYTSAEFLNRANQINDLLYNVDQSWSQIRIYGWGPLGYVPNAIGTPSPSLTAFLADAANPDALVERLNRLFLHGTMSRRDAQDDRQRGHQARRRPTRCAA